MDKQGLLDFLQSLKSAKVSGMGENDQNSAITGYPEYDEIIRQYYTGMISNWSMGEFSEKIYVIWQEAKWEVPTILDTILQILMEMV